MSDKKITAIISPADRAKAQSVLDALRKKGFRVGEASARGKTAALLFLSESFATDEEAQERFFALDSAGRTVIPVDLDGAAQPELIRSALIAKNAIPAQGRTPEEIAERVASAEAFRKKKFPLAKLLIAAAAALLVIGAVVMLGRAAPEEKPNAALLAEAETRYGLTEEDLAAVMDVVIVSDKIGFFTLDDFSSYGAWPDTGRFATLDEWNDVHWYSTEDGQELEMHRYDDLRVLELMPNLHHLSMVLVEADEAALPDLSGASFLEDVSIQSCNIDTLAWIAGTPVKSAVVRFTPIADFAPLTACERLSELSVDMYGTSVTTDFASFAPPKLRYLRLWHANAEGTIDFSGMKGCGELRTLYLGDVPIEELSFISGAASLRELTLDQDNRLRSLAGLEGLSLESLRLFWCESLEDVSALKTMTGSLRTLRIGGCGRIADFTPISGCTGLHTVELQDLDNLRDLSFLAHLTGLKSIVSTGCELRDLNFLEGFSDAVGIELELSGDIRDYSGLAYVKNYQSLTLDPRSRYNGRGSLENFYAYLDGAKLKKLCLYNCTDLDLSRLPQVSGELNLIGCDLRSLEGMPAWQISRLQLNRMNYLTSLNGIENLVSMQVPNALELVVCSCPRLTDWSAVENAALRFLQLEDLYFLPKMDGIDFRYLKLRALPETTDLHLLDGVDSARNYEHIMIEEMPLLRDISSLGRLKIWHLTIPPQVREQAEELVASGSVQEFEIAYPEGSWENDDSEVKLLSLDELETLPKALLRRVRSLVLAGDSVVDEERFEVEQDWDHKDRNGRPALYLRDRESGEKTPVPAGTLTDLSALSALTGLERLSVWNQPLESLDGVQGLSALRDLSVRFCGSHLDASAAFTLQGLEELSLRCSGVESIRGVQNLTELRRLDISLTAVTDISPLAESRFDAAARGGEGFRLQLSGRTIGDYGPLGAIENYSELSFDGDADSARWADALEGVQIRRLQFSHSGFGNESFAAFVRTHPELRVLWIPWNESITDLTPLLELPDLETADISYSMKKAAASLEGKAYDFELIVEQP